MDYPTRLPLSTEQTLRLLCADYARRTAMLRDGKINGDVAFAAKLVNDIIDEVTASVYSRMHAYAENFGYVIRQDIAECRGYCASPLSGVMSEGSYKKYKHMVKYEIAKRLGLA